MSESQIEVSGKEEEPKDKIRALIVEDNESILRFLKLVVRFQGGFNAVYAESTSDALRVLRQAKGEGKPFGLVFSDLGLTDNKEGGLKIAEATKAERLAKQFILFTASAHRFEGESKEQLEKQGINLVVGKPASTEVLEKHLNDAENIIKSAQTAQ